MSVIPPSPFILVDGSSYLFRAYHALPPLTTRSGQPTGAIYGVVTMLLKLLETYHPKHMAVIFDTKGKNFRHELYPDYKANRTEMPEDLGRQIKPLHTIIKALGLPLLAVDGVEADDVIGTLTKKAEAQGFFTVISTGDKDMAQLVNEQVILINTLSDKVLDESGVQEKFGVGPNRIIDYLSLVGDTSDNIPGVHKVGPKTAVKWLSLYDSLEGVIAHAGEIKGKVGEYLRDTIEELPLYRELTTIKTDVELSQTPEQLTIEPYKKEELLDLYKEYELHTLGKKLQESSEGILGGGEDSVKEDSNYETVVDKSSFVAWIDKIKKAEVFAFDTETTSLNYMEAELVGVSLSITVGEGCYIPLGHITEEGDPCVQLEKDFVLKEISVLLGDSQKLKVGHNLKYDLEVLKNYDITAVGPFFDTMLASYIINSTATRHNLDAVSQKYLGHKMISYDEVTGKGSKKISFNQVGIDKATQYAAEDAAISFQLYKEFNSIFEKEESLLRVFKDLEMPLMEVLVGMERRGVLIDPEMLAEHSQQLEDKILGLGKEIFDLSGEPFNINSPKQLQQILFEKMGLPILEKTSKGQPSTAEPVLQELSIDYPMPKNILEYRSLSKLKSTYTDALPKQIVEKTGRVHTSYHQAVTATGRLSSSDPNLQNIPVKTSEGRRIRHAFIAAKGYQLISADYSQIELRIMAHLAQDKTLLQTFAQGLDVHTATASEVFNVELDDVTASQRRHAKAINFGLIYGMSAFGLSKQLGITRNEAQSYMDFYFERYPQVKEFMDNIRQKASEQGYVETLFGRRLYLPDINSKVMAKRKAAERAAINAPMQGGQADIIKKAMIDLDAWISEFGQGSVKMIMQVHDELVFEVSNKALDYAQENIIKIMQNVIPLSVDLVVGVGIAPNWEEAH